MFCAAPITASFACYAFIRSLMFHRPGIYHMTKTIRHFILPCIALLLVVPAAHAGLYKQVDANGNVTYTDKPPKANSQAQGITSRQMPSKEAEAQGGSGQSVIPEAALADPLKASGAVAGVSSAMQMLTFFCAANVPSSADQVNALHKGWEAANSQLIVKSWYILREKLPERELLQMTVSLQSAARAQTQKLERESPEAKQKLCAALLVKFADPHMNLMANKKLVDTIQGVKLKVYPN